MTTAKPITINTQLLDALARIVHEEPFRPIGALLFARDELVATNGHILVRIARPELTSEPFGISRDHLRMVIAAQDRCALDDYHDSDDDRYPRRRMSREVRFWPHGHHVEIGVDDSSARMNVPRVDVSTFPSAAKLDELTPSPRDGAPLVGIHFDPKYLVLVGRIAEAVRPADEWREGIRIESWGGLADPMVFASRSARIVLMPMRVSGMP